MLADLDVIVLDCQTTGSTPERGHLLEVAWQRTGQEVVSRLVRLPDGAGIPPRVSKLTGIRARDLGDAMPADELRDRLSEAAAGVPAVAHFARFERSFLAPEPEAERAPRAPLDWICTHEIVCRLLPGLPRRGLRAVAGYFGHVMTGTKRAADHVRATAAVWAALGERLRGEGVRTLPHLRAWLRRVEPAHRTGKDFPLPRERRLALPDAPGVYRLLGKGGEVLYLGKATSLKRRVNAHFTSHGNKELLTQAWDVAVSVTGSALEAAVHEADAIKEHAPPYNVALRERAAVWFASPDLRAVASSPGGVHVVGPLPTRDAPAPIAALCAPPPEDDAQAWESALGVRVDSGALRAGLALFRERHGVTTRRALLHLGAQLWFATEEEADAERPPAERAAALLEASVRRSAHLLRRARWLVHLSESKLEWAPREPGEPSRLTITRGRVAPELPSGPPDFARAHAERLACFDAATYDRLRVLTTELRRLVAEERDLTLRLGPRLRLDRARLSRRLAWV